MTERHEHIIRIQGLVNRFGPVTVHDGLQLGVRRDEILGLVGGSGKKAAAVSAKLKPDFAAGVTLAISVEPPGGSTTGAPTGPVVAMGPVKASQIN